MPMGKMILLWLINSWKDFNQGQLAKKTPNPSSITHRQDSHLAITSVFSYFPNHCPPLLMVKHSLCHCLLFLANSSSFKWEEDWSMEGNQHQRPACILQDTQLNGTSGYPQVIFFPVKGHLLEFRDAWMSRVLNLASRLVNAYCA